MEAYSWNTDCRLADVPGAKEPLDLWESQPGLLINSTRPPNSLGYLSGHCIKFKTE